MKNLRTKIIGLGTSLVLGANVFFGEVSSAYGENTLGKGEGNQPYVSPLEDGKISSVVDELPLYLKNASKPDLIKRFISQFCGDYSSLDFQTYYKKVKPFYNLVKDLFSKNDFEKFHQIIFDCYDLNEDGQIDLNDIKISESKK